MRKAVTRARARAFMGWRRMILALAFAGDRVGTTTVTFKRGVVGWRAVLTVSRNGTTTTIREGYWAHFP